MRERAYMEQTVLLSCLAHLQEAYERLVSALVAIQGPEDSGPWIETYRAAGGGYEGLQAVARQALSDV